MTLTTVQEDSETKMWSEYLEDVKEFDTALTETWKEDANGVLTFVSPNLPVPVFVTIIISEDRYFLCNGRRFHYRKLQTAVTRFWRSDSISSPPSIPSTY